MNTNIITEANFQRLQKVRDEVGGIENLMRLISLGNSKGAVISATCKVYGWKEVAAYIANMMQP